MDAMLTTAQARYNCNLDRNEGKLRDSARYVLIDKPST